MILFFSVFTTLPYTVNHAWNTDFYDDARDILVGKHIVEYGTIVDRGPLADGGTFSDSNSKLLNSPVYYYVLAFFWFFSKSPTAVLLNWTLFLSLLLPISAYYLGKQYKDSQLGFILAAVVILNPFFSQSTLHIWQPHLVIPLTFLIIGTFFRYLRNSTIFNACLVILLAFLTIHIHYSGLLVALPIIFITLLRHFRSHIKEKFSLLRVTPYLVFIVCLLIWMFLTYNIFFGDQLVFFIEMGKTVLSKPIYDEKYSSIIEKISKPLALVIGTTFSKINALTILTSILCLVPLAEFLSKKYKKSHYTYFVVILISGYIFSIFFHRKMYDIYLIPLIILILLRFSICLNFLLDKIVANFKLIIVSNKNRGRKILYSFFAILALSGLLILIVIPFLYNLIYRINQPISVYFENVNIAHAILTDSTITGEAHYTMAHLATPNEFFGGDGWGTTGLWLILEELTNRKIVEVIKPVKSEPPFKPISEDAKAIYLICTFRDMSDVDPNQNKCVERFIRKRNYLDTNFAIIYAANKRIVYRFNLNENKSGNIEFDIYYEK